MEQKNGNLTESVNKITHLAQKIAGGALPVENAGGINNALISGAAWKPAELPTDARSLIHWLRQMLSHMHYSNLSEILCISPKIMSRRLRGTDPWEFDEYVRLYTYLSYRFTDLYMTPAEFLTRFRMQNNITIDQMAMLEEWYCDFKAIMDEYFSDTKWMNALKFIEAHTNIYKGRIAWPAAEYVLQDLSINK